VISEAEYKQRRLKFLKKMKKGSMAIFFAAPQKIRSNDTQYPYRQDSNFYYLCGFKEDSSALMFIKTKQRQECYMFVHKKDPLEELWNGKRLGVKKAKKYFDVDAVFAYDMFTKKLKEESASLQHLYYDFSLEYAKVKLLKSYVKNIYSLHNSAKIVQKMRLIKSDAEIALIKKAIAITKEAHHRAVTEVSKLNYEYELQAEIEYVFRYLGAYSDAYTSIVASGDNANILHYIENNSPLKKDGLVLIDAGCEYEYYASDITRTIPASGKFTPVQKSLYELVLKTQKEIIAMIKPGLLRSELQSKTEKLLTKGLCEIGVIKVGYKKALKKKLIKEFYPHGIGHWMGIDVHDMAPYKSKKLKEIPLKAGMILTIEPGIYISKKNRNVEKKFRGIGIRIEDNILVTEDGYENLSVGIVKEPKEIELLALS
jgi:Xaa-Pro aminopeptidase